MQEPQEPQPDALPELRELQSISLNILKLYDATARELGVTYYAGDGTLLGAVRHNGFVPWDDEVRVFMPRLDYDRFIAGAPGLLEPKGLSLHSIETDPNHYTASAKLRLTADPGFVDSRIEHLCSNPYPAMDIHPLDYVPKRWSMAQSLQAAAVRAANRLLWAKLGVIGAANYRVLGMRFRKYYLLKTISLFTPVSVIHGMLRRLMSIWTNDHSNRFLTCLTSGHPAISHTVPKNVYGVPKYKPFHDFEVPVPASPTYVLISVHGPYKRLPPKKKRHPYHRYVPSPNATSSANVSFSETAGQDLD